MTQAGSDKSLSLSARFRRFVLFTGLWVGTAVVLVIGLFTLSIYLMTNEAPDRETLWAVEREPGYTILDNQGRTIAIRGTFYGDVIDVADLPPHLVQAFLAIEDRRFYDHQGIDPLGLARALIANMLAGRTVQGGSTITQQLAKNLFLSNDRTIARKASEFTRAIWLERHLTKDEILKLYLNRIYLGAGTYGVDAAARFYFDKPATEVSLAEAAMLAGLPKAPTRYAPTADLTRAQGRATLVLANMRRAGFISKDQEVAARDAPAEPIERPGTDGLGYFIDAVIKTLQDTSGKPEADVTIETTIDLDLQAMAEAAVKTVMDESAEAMEAGQAAILSMTRDGAVRAMVGGRAYADSQFNRATQALRQPGSAFKPFVYLAALEQGISPRDPVFDEPVQVGQWAPENYGGHYRGRISVTEALQFSVNSVAVYLSETIGREKVIETAQRLGIKTPIVDQSSISLGTSEVTLQELTAAYLAFARNGMTVAPHIVKRVTAESGAILFEQPEARPRRVINGRVAQDMTHMLHQVMLAGTGTAAQLEGHPAAGKTGTSQDSRDAWFIGFTGHLVTGVWVGNDDSSPMKQVTGGNLPAHIWRLYMAEAHDGRRPVALKGAVPAEPTTYERDGLRTFLVRLKERLDRVRDERPDRYARRYEDDDRERRRGWRDRDWWPFN